MLKPIMPGTARPKTFGEMTAGELAGFAGQCYATQFQNLRSGWPVDDRAVELADRLTDEHGDEELRVQRESFRGFRTVKEGDVAVLREKLAAAEREAAGLRKGR